MKKSEGRLAQQLLGEGRLLHERPQALLGRLDHCSVHCHFSSSANETLLSTSQKYQKCVRNRGIVTQSMVHFQKCTHHISYIVYFFPSRSVTESLSTGALFLLCTFLLPSAKYAADCDRSTVNSLIYFAAQIEPFSSKLAPKRRGQCSLGDAVRSTTSA